MTKNSDIVVVNFENVYDVLKTYSNKVFKNNAYLSPFEDNKKIEKKLNNSIKSVANNEVEPNDVYMFYDSTLFGAADNGMLFTGSALYHYDFLGSSEKIEYKELKNAVYKVTIKKDKEGKETKEEDLHIDYGKNKKINIGFSGIDKQAFVEFIKALKKVSEQRETANDAQKNDNNSIIVARTLTDLPKPVQYDYCKVIVNFFLNIDGNSLNQKSFNCLYSLLINLNFNTDERFSILSYVQKKESTETICNRIFENVDAVTKEIIKNALIKELVYSHIKLNVTGSPEKNNFILDLANQFSVTEEQIKLFIEAYNNEQKIWDDDSDDATLENGLRTLATNAAAIGVPLAAVYFTGAIGFSAVGITSGLATLGFGGIFGLSSMVTGIGAVLLIGLGAKKGLEHLTGQKEIDKRKRKEMLLLQFGKKCQEELNQLYSDINFISGKLSDVIEQNMKLKEKTQEVEKKLAELVNTLKQYSAAGRYISKEKVMADMTAAKQSIPRYLDIDKVNAITSEPTRKKFRDPILQCYEKIDDKYVLKEGLTNEQIQTVKVLLSQLGYFSAETALKQGADKAFSKIKGMFN